MPKIRHRRKKSELPFADALAAANKRLSRALKEREQAQKSLDSLDHEIPRLQRTMQALREQLDKQVYSPEFTHEEIRAAINERNTQIPEGVTLPAEDLSGMGSRFDPEDELLPDAEGTPLVPEE